MRLALTSCVVRSWETRDVASLAEHANNWKIWLNLRDVYWERQGRVSVDIVLIFGALLSVGIWGGPFFNGIIRALLRLEQSIGL